MLNFFTSLAGSVIICFAFLNISTWLKKIRNTLWFNNDILEMGACETCWCFAKIILLKVALCLCCRQCSEIILPLSMQILQWSFLFSFCAFCTRVHISVIRALKNHKKAWWCNSPDSIFSACFYLFFFSCSIHNQCLETSKFPRWRRFIFFYFFFLNLDLLFSIFLAAAWH